MMGRFGQDRDERSNRSHLKRLPDGETGIRKTWIRFLQQVLADDPGIEVASDVPVFKFTQWDGKLLREIPRLRLKPGARLDPATFKTGYADMAIGSWRVFDRLQTEGVIPAGVKFQISLPTPIAPTYNNMVPADRPVLIAADDPNWLARYLHVHTGPHRGDFVTGDAQAFTGKEQKDLARPHHLADTFGERLPFLAREQSPEFILARKDLVADPLKDVVP
jgi:hypothetical protein